MAYLYHKSFEKGKTAELAVTQNYGLIKIYGKSTAGLPKHLSLAARLFIHVIVPEFKDIVSLF